MTHTMDQRRSRATAWLITVTTILSVLGLVMIALQSFGVATVFSVTSDDMSPAVKKGSLVVTAREDISDIKEGDVIVMSSEDGAQSRVTRISSIEQELGSSVYAYTVWADNAAIPDEWLHKTKGSVQKVIFDIPLLGWFLIALRFPLTMVILFGGMVWFGIYYTRDLYEYNPRMVKARRIAEERLEGMRYGGVDDIIALFEPHGGAVVLHGDDSQKIENETVEGEQQ